MLVNTEVFLGGSLERASCLARIFRWGSPSRIFESDNFTLINTHFKKQFPSSASLICFLFCRSLPACPSLPAHPLLFLLCGPVVAVGILRWERFWKLAGLLRCPLRESVGSQRQARRKPCVALAKHGEVVRGGG